MRLQSLFQPAALASCVIATPTVYLAGDSTMAKGGGGSGTQGWGEYLHYSLTVPVVNDAIAGRSARSYTREGRFDTLVETVKSGDWVIIEFGHNDGTSSPDNGRSDCPGSGTEVCQYVYDGVTETVYTFPRYLDWAAKNLTAKGANVLLSAQTPNNPAETGTFVSSPPRFVGLAKAAATSSDVDYVDHYAYGYAAYAALTVAQVNAFFPNDHTHTAPAGAALVAQSFVRGLVCGDSLLKQYVRNSTSTIPGKCL